MQRLQNPAFQSKYLGDGLYACFDGYQIWLLACNGQEILEQVALEKDTLEQFLGYIEKIYHVKITVEKNQPTL
jgi:hypothetical protein